MRKPESMSTLFEVFDGVQDLADGEAELPAVTGRAGPTTDAARRQFGAHPELWHDSDAPRPRPG